jgi:ABC-type transporter Mla MlaB component
MSQLETSPAERVRVIGPLTGAVLLMLLDMAKAAEVMLDLSEVRDVDTDGVRLLARLGTGVCDQLACPSWLAMRVESERRSQPSAPAAENPF